MSIEVKEPCPHCGGRMERNESYSGKSFDVCWVCQIKIQLVRGPITKV